MKKILLFALTFFIGFTVAYSQLATDKEIFNNVWDRVNNRLMGAPWAGAQGSFETVQAILNNVWDRANNRLRMSQDAEYTEATIPASCEDGTRIRVTDSQTAGCSEQACENQQYVCIGSGSTDSGFSLGTGIVLNSTSILAIKPNTVTSSQNVDLCDNWENNAQTGTTGIAYNLPALTDTSCSRRFEIFVESGAGQVTINPNGTDKINTLNTSQSFSGEKVGYAFISNRGTYWFLLTTKSVPTGGFAGLELANTFTQLQTLNAGLDVIGGAVDIDATTHINLPLVASPTPTVDGRCAWNTTTHKWTCGHAGVATVTTSQVLCRATGTSVNDSGSGSGSDFNHTVTCSIPASSLYAGDTLSVRIMGKLSTGATGTTILAGLKQSTTTDIIRTTGASTGNNVAGNYWFLDFVLRVSANPGASVAVTGYAGNILVGMRDTFNSSQTGSVNLATNATLTLTPFTRWSAAGGSDNEIDVQEIIVIRN